MSRITLFITAILCLLAGPLPAWSQSTATTSLKPGLGWRIEENRGADGSFQVVEENSLGEGFRRNVVFLNGKPFTRFVVGSLVVYRLPDRGEIVEGGGEETFGGPVATRPESEWTWVEPRWQVREQEVDGVRCIVYRRPVEGEKTFETAYIHVGTGLPVRIEKNSAVRKYRFSFAPPIQLPAEIAEALKQREQSLQRARQFYQVPQ